MTKTFKTALVAAMLLAGSSQAAFAQTPAAAANSGPIVPGLGVLNLDAVVGNSSAFKTAQQQRPVTYKPQIDQAQARQRQISTQLQPLVTKFQADSKLPSASTPAGQASLQQQATVIQAIQEKGQQELQAIVAPAALSEAYVLEQINERVDQAVKNAMAKNKISLLLNAQVVMAMNNTAYNLNPVVLNELNLLIPAAQLVPPAGWKPREVREQEAAQAAQAGAAAAPAAPAGPQPSGR